MEGDAKRAGANKVLLEMIKLSKKMLTEEENDAMLNFISQEELPALRSEIRETAERIYSNWGNLESIVQRHEATIQKRWTNKSIPKRRELLLTTWPGMNRDHRPDLSLDKKKTYDLTTWKEEWKGLQQGTPRQHQMYEGSQREALLMPYINLHDLTKKEPLLLMINARARQPPHAFSKRDLQLSTPLPPGVTQHRNLRGYVMDLDGQQSVPETYGELRKGEFKFFLTATGIDTRLSAGRLSPGDGLWVLEIQDRIYKFLLDTVQRIFHDIPPSDLIGPRYKTQPEPLLPSANCREHGLVSLANTNLEAMYCTPGQMDLDRLHLLMTAKVNEEEDKLWALREDPSRFLEGLEDFIAHRPEYVPDPHGCKHHTTIINESETQRRHDLKNLGDMFYDKFLISYLEDVEFWGDVANDITVLRSLKKQHFDGQDIKSGDRLSAPFALALFRVQLRLCTCVDQRLSILRRMAYSSPPLRPYVQRASPDTIDEFVGKPGKQPSRYVSKFLSILDGLFNESTLMMMMGFIGGINSLMEGYDKFINTVPDAHQAVSSSVAQEISNLALLSECLRQIHLFQPLAGTLHFELEMLYSEGVLDPYLNANQRETTSLGTFKSSVRLQSMIAATAKSPYPVHKKRTAASVEAMQNAETLLDQMWVAMSAEMKAQNCLPKHSNKVLFHQGRQLQRTPDWVEPVKPSKQPPPQLATPGVLAQPFGGLSIDDGDDHKKKDFPKGKAKIKTRGTAASQTSTSPLIPKTEQEEQSPGQAIQVDRRAFKVLSALFHTAASASKPGEVPWTEFLHAMQSAGFWMEKLYGSVWQFTPCVGNGGLSTASMRSILFHEPHPHSRIPFRQARRHGRRLARAYGWTGQTFVLKQ